MMVMSRMSENAASQLRGSFGLTNMVLSCRAEAVFVFSSRTKYMQVALVSGFNGDLLL